MSTGILFAVTYPVPVNILIRFISTITTLYTFLITENPLVWKFRQGKNKDADGRGPYYVHNAPLRQIDEGKGILASLEFMKKYGAYLFTGRIKTPDGKGAAGATLDFWQACSKGNYYFDRYELRGKITTDSEGCFEVISVKPGPYLGRAGHFHYIITPSASDSAKYEQMTTQSYVCTANDKNEMNTDFVDWFYMRNPLYNRMVTSWSIPEANGDKAVGNFPTLHEVITDPGTRDRLNTQIKQWNDRLATLEDSKKGEGSLKVVAGGYAETCLSPIGSLGLW